MCHRLETRHGCNQRASRLNLLQKIEEIRATVAEYHRALACGTACVCVCLCARVCVVLYMGVCLSGMPPQSLLNEPNPKSPANSEAAKLFTENKVE